MTPALVTVDKSGTQSVEATGHPTDCTEPVPGSVQGTEPHSVTVNNASGDEKPLATYDHATLHFDSHSHDYTAVEGCHQNSSHDLDKASGYLNKGNWSSSISISPANESASPVLVKNNDVATDPTTGDPVNAVGTGINNSVSDT